MFNNVSKAGLIGDPVILDNPQGSGGRRQEIKPELPDISVDIVCLDNLTGDPVVPTAGSFQIYYTDTLQGGFKLGPVIDATLCGGSALADGIAEGVSFSANATAIKVVPSGVNVAVAYRVVVKQNLLGGNASPASETVVASNDYRLDIARGLVEGLSSLSKFGENPDIDVASDFEVIWDRGGPYIPPTEARIHDVVSTATEDAGTVLSSGNATGGELDTLEDSGADFVADGVVSGDYVLNDSQVTIGVVLTVATTVLTVILGMRSPNDGTVEDRFRPGDAYRVITNASTGVSIFHVSGLDGNRLELDEFIVLNAGTPVATMGEYTRQFRARVFGPGTTGAVGLITSIARIDGTVTCQILNGNNQTLMAVYTIPIDKVGYLTQWWAGLSKTGSPAVVEVRLHLGVIDGVGYVTQLRELSSDGTSEFEYEPKTPIRISGGADIWVEGDTSANNTGIVSGFDLDIEDL